MQTSHFTKFENLLLRSKNELGTSVLLILAWIATSDGTIDQAEAKRLSKISVDTKHGRDVHQITELAKNRDLDAIELACEVVQRYFREEKATLFLEMAIGMAIADGYLLPEENHILRFLSDLLGVSRSSFNALFVEMTGKELPNPSDPSKASFWKTRDGSQRRKQSDSSSESTRASSPPPPDQKAVHSYAVLGLEWGATLEDVKRAYRRLAQVHHPDRFSSLGEESVAAATSTFQRIKEAYDYLVNHA